MKKHPLLFFLLILLTFSPIYAEDVTITTYFPAPYGSYKQLNIDDGDTDPAKYGSLQIVREETEHLGSHLAFIRGGTTSRMSLGYKQSSDAFGFGPAVTGAFDPTFIAISPAGNAGIGNSAPTGVASPADGAATGNLDVNDVYLRSSARWASSSLSSTGGFTPPRASGAYLGDGARDRLISTSAGTPAVGFHPRRVLLWRRHSDDKTFFFETFEGLQTPSGVAVSLSRKGDEFKIRDNYFKIVAGENGFRVGNRGVDVHEDEWTNGTQLWNGQTLGYTYYWMAWD